MIKLNKYIEGLNIATHGQAQMVKTSICDVNIKCAADTYSKFLL